LFEIEEGKVVYKGEKENMQSSAIMLKLDGTRLSRLQQILIDSGWHFKSNVKESAKATLYRNAIVLVAYKLLDWAIEAHLG
jgi:hypothetical protein